MSVDVPFDILVGSGGDKQWDGLVTEPTSTSSSTTTGDVAILLLHGTAGDMHGGHMDGTAAALAEGCGCPVIRVTMTGSSEPKRVNAARGAIEYAKKSVASCARVENIVLSGHSSGARQAAILAAEMLQDERNALGKPRAAGCVFFSYPLHGPGAKKIHDAEALQVKLPMLFVRGTGDAMCKQEHFDALLPRLAAPAGVHSVEGGDHSLKLSKKMMPATTEEAQTLMRAAAVTYVKDKMLCGGGGGGGGSSKSGGDKNGGAKNGDAKNGDKNGGGKRARDEGGEIAPDPAAEKHNKTSKKTDAGGAAAEAAPLASAHLSGVRVVVTGKVPGMSRKEAEEAVEAAGGVPQKAVSGKTDLLVFCEDGQGEKQRKKEAAEEKGVRVIDADTFLRILAGDEKY